VLCYRAGRLGEKPSRPAERALSGDRQRRGASGTPTVAGRARQRSKPRLFAPDTDEVERAGASLSSRRRERNKRFCEAGGQHSGAERFKATNPRAVPPDRTERVSATCPLSESEQNETRGGTRRRGEHFSGATPRRAEHPRGSGRSESDLRFLYREHFDCAPILDITDNIPSNNEKSFAYIGSRWVV
jgi:hypothetical protein